MFYSAFLTFGTINSVLIPKNISSIFFFWIYLIFKANASQGFGYIEFEKEEDAKNAIDNMHLSELYGSVIRCNLAHSNPFKIMNNKNYT